MASWQNQKKTPAVKGDYNRRRYGNPLFPAAGQVSRRGGRGARRPEGPGLLGRVLAFIALVLITGGAWYAFWSPALRVDAIEIEGASPATEETVRAALDKYAASNAFIFPRRTILFFDESDAKKAVEKSIYLDAVEIRKKLPHTVTVTVREKAIKAVFLREGRLYGLDDSGFNVRLLSSKEIDLMGDLPQELNAVPVVSLGTESMDVPEALKVTDPVAAGLDAKEALKLSKNAWPLIIDDRSDDVRKNVHQPGTQAFSTSTIGIVLQANARLPDVTQEAVRWFTPDEAADSIDALMVSDWHVYLSTVTPFDVQAERLSLVLKEKIGTRKGELEYVDLRYNERIFYRMKGGAGDTPQTLRPTTKVPTVPAATPKADPPAATPKPETAEPSDTGTHTAE